MPDIQGHIAADAPLKWLPASGKGPWQVAAFAAVLPASNAASLVLVQLRAKRVVLVSALFPLQYRDATLVECLAEELAGG